MRTLFLALMAIVLVSCSGEDKKKRGVDYEKFKTEVTLTPEQEKNYDAITAKFKKQQEQNFEAAKAQGGKMDRVALAIKNEDLRAKQAAEMSAVLNAEQMQKFTTYVDKNSRKRPRYNNELLAKIKTETQLSEEQFAMLNAANDAFERSFNDAHDVYHGNNKLAAEYWEKFDNQRKGAMKGVLTQEQYTKYEGLVKDQRLREKE